ncbi:MAG: tRNA (guanosine(46)-N7)-methyltransferase TrmB [Rectinemataceae bacterium]|jgi:tRNA (guanine-N7-)-methyltransferase
MSDTSDRGIRTYVLRAGRMTDAQKRALDGLWTRYGLEFDPKTRLDLASAFGNANPVVAEIGFGMGRATWQIAMNNPTVNYLGLEVHTPGVGRLLSDVDSRGIGNVRIFRHDAIEVFERMIAPSSFAGLHIFYPDPWPKKRHHKRRLIREGLAELLASRLASGAYLYFVTDIEEYGLWALDVLSRTEGLLNRFAGFAPRQDWRPETKFESHAARDGRGAWELVFERR